VGALRAALRVYLARQKEQPDAVVSAKPDRA